MAKKKPCTLPISCFNAFNKALAEVSDRARVLLVAAWIDEFIKTKLKNEFSKGNSDARQQLFSLNGPFANFSGGLNTVFCVGWIEADVYHDINIIRKIRNACAHEVDPISLNDKKYRDQIEKLIVPHREYYDWGQLRTGSTEDGFIIYSGEKPSDVNVKEDLYIPGEFTFRMAASVIITVLLDNLNIPFSTEDSEIVQITISDHLKRENEDGKN